jgi:hypothetical protein
MVTIRGLAAVTELSHTPTSLTLRMRHGFAATVSLP